MKATLAALGFLLALAGAYLLFWPVPIDPVAWTPPPAPALVGALAPNTRLAAATLLAEGQVRGPEDVAFDAAGVLHTGTADGRIVRIDPDSGALSVLAEVPGRSGVGGLAFDAAGNVLACVGDVGLVSFSPAGAMRTLVAEVQGRPLHMANEVAIAADGTVYFTELTWKKPESDRIFGEFLEHRPRGSVFAYDPVRGAVRLVQDGLYMANGLVVSPDGRSLLVAENATFSIRRLWIDDSGRAPEVFVASLPGVPDNLAFDDTGLLWVALVASRDTRLERLAPHPLAIKVLFRTLSLVTADPIAPYGFVIALDHEGRVVHNLQDPSGRTLSHVTTAVPHDGWLYFGSYRRSAIGRLRAPD